MRSFFEQASRLCNRAVGYLQQFQDGNKAPLFLHERFTRLDPIDWSQIEYFKDRDYSPENRQILGHYSLAAKTSHGLYDVYLQFEGDLFYSALGERGIFIPLGTDSFEEPCLLLQDQTKEQLSAIFDAFISGTPLEEIIDYAPDNSIAAQFLSAEGKYGFAEIRGDLEKGTPFEDWTFNSKITEWGFPDKFRMNPYQDNQYRNLPKQAEPAPAV